MNNSLRMKEKMIMNEKMITKFKNYDKRKRIYWLHYNMSLQQVMDKNSIKTICLVLNIYYNSVFWSISPAEIDKTFNVLMFTLWKTE